MEVKENEEDGGRWQVGSGSFHCLRLRSSVIGAGRSRAMHHKTRHHSCHPWGFSIYALWTSLFGSGGARMAGPEGKGPAQSWGIGSGPLRLPPPYCLLSSSALAWPGSARESGVGPHPHRLSSTHKGLALTGPLLNGEVASLREQGGSVEMEMRGQLPPGTARRSLWGGGGVRDRQMGVGAGRGVRSSISSPPSSLTCARI